MKFFSRIRGKRERGIGTVNTSGWIVFGLVMVCLLSPIHLHLNHSFEGGTASLMPQIHLLETKAQTSTTKVEVDTTDAVALALPEDLQGWKRTVYQWMNGLGALFVGWGGWLLDTSLSLFVVYMADLIEALKLNETIYSIWQVVRDLFNLLFIFGLIWIGFQTILRTNESSSRRLLGSLLVAALLINFSLYITQVIVDFTNVAAYQISELMTVDETERITIGSSTFAIKKISPAFPAASSLENFFLSNRELTEQFFNPAGINRDGTSGWGVFLMGFASMAMGVILGFVMAAGAIILFTRFVVLVFLMMFSPFMFLSWVFPAFGGVGQRYWGYLFNQALVGPAFIFTLYVALLILQGAGQLQQFTIAGVIVYFVMTAGFAWGALMIARSMGAFGAQQAINLGNSARRGLINTANNIRKGAQGTVTGLAGRGAIGYWANRIEKDMEKRGVSETNVFRRMAATGAKAKFGGAVSSRQVADAKKVAGQKRARYAQQQLTLNAIAAGSKPGATGPEVVAMERRVRGATNEQIIELLGNDKLSKAERENIVRSMSSEQFGAAMKAKPEDLNDTQIADLKKTRSQVVITRVSQQANQGQNLKDVINKATTAELEEMGSDTLMQNAVGLSAAQMSDLKKSKKMTETEWRQINDKRNTELVKAFKQNSASVFAGRKDKEVAKLPPEILTDYESAQHLTGNVLKQILDEDTLSQADRQKIKENLGKNPLHTKPSAQRYLMTPHGQNFIQ